jgi:DNA (cytosine-5)-methyltransferase 1
VKLNDLTLFAVDTLASHSAQQENEAAQTTLDIYGQQCTTPFAYYDPATLSWKTYEGICLWGSIEFSATWPKSGMTQSGKSFQQPPLVRHTKETGYSLWPTPTTQEIEHPNAELTTTGRRKSKNGKSSHSLGLADAVQMWPTPTVDNSKNVTRKSGSFQSLVRAVNESLWPTPTASSWGSTGHRAMLQTKVDNGTISESDKKQMVSGNGGKLNPTWVEWLMGFPTGWTDLKD